MLPHPLLPLEKEKWKGHPIPIGYTTNTYYDVTIDRTDDGFTMRMVLTDCSDTPITHTAEEYDFPDKLYEDYRPNSRAWGMVDNNGTLIAAIETEVEEWSN
ncbi:MAG: GNAT family N-acetyltransferase, partial [Clostridia bacterium]|nr:GNAT family N-acetyltransferase [Clostridia bacterium]